MGVPVMWIALEQVERVRAELAAFPVRPVDKVPCKQAIGLLSPQIRELRVKGYSRKEIAEALTAKGLPVSETVLRSYERGAGDGRSHARGGRGRKGAAGSRPGARVESVVVAEAKAPVGEDPGRREAVPVPVGKRDGVAVEDGAGARNGAAPCHGNAGGEAAAELRRSSGEARKVAESAGKGAVLSTDDERKSKFEMRKDTEDL